MFAKGFGMKKKKIFYAAKKNYFNFKIVMFDRIIR